jgi:hypothetical protein
MEALDRTGNWRWKNVCPACTYQLQGEKKLTFSILVTMDGNNSLKRVLRCALDPTASDNAPHEKNHGAEQEDERCVPDDLYLPNSMVDAHGRLRQATAVPTPPSQEELEAIEAPLRQQTKHSKKGKKKQSDNRENKQDHPRSRR